MSLRITLFTAFLLPLLAACSGSNGNNDFSLQRDPAQLRVTHASADAPAVNVYVDGEAALENVDFKQSSGLVDLAAPATYEVEVRGILPDGSEVTVIGPVDLSLEAGERTDVVAIGDLFDAQGALSIAPKVLDPVEIEDSVTDVRISVLHAAPAVPAVDIYVTSPGVALDGVTPITAAFGDAAGPVAISANTPYQIRIAPQDTANVVFDSGTLSFPAGTELLLVAVENTTGVGPSPVTVLAVGPETASEVVDVNTGAAVRVVHNSADTPAVDVLVDGTAVIDALRFPNATDYDDLVAPAGTYNVVVAADVDNSIAPIDADLTLKAAESYTVIAAGSLADSSLAPILTEDDRRSIATAAVVEVIHGSYLVARDIPVDVYLTSDGVITGKTPAISGLAYQEATGQLSLTPGNYWITVTVAGDPSVVAYQTAGPLTLEAGVNYTVIARDPSIQEGVGQPLIKATLLTD